MDRDKIIAYLKDDLTDIEKVEVEHWILENKAEFSRLKYVWEKSGVDPKEEPDIEKAWKRINPENRYKTGKKKLRILATRFQRIAAVLVLAIFIGAIVYNHYARSDRSQVAWLEVKNDSESARKVQLNDGTIIWLNEASEIRYPKKFDKTREVQLEGEAFFEVKHNTKKPFVVYTKNSITRDLGTSFNIKQDNSGDVQVVVVTGSVAFSGINNKNKMLVLTKGELGLFSAGKNSLEKQQNKNLNFLAWKTGILSFDKMPLANVCTELTNYYKTKVKIGDDALKQLNLTADYDHKTLEEVLDIMQLTLNIQYRKYDSCIVLRSKK